MCHNSSEIVGGGEAEWGGSHIVLTHHILRNTETMRTCCKSPQLACDAYTIPTVHVKLAIGCCRFQYQCIRWALVVGMFGCWFSCTIPFLTSFVTHVRAVLAGVMDARQTFLKGTLYCGVQLQRGSLHKAVHMWSCVCRASTEAEVSDDVSVAVEIASAGSVPGVRCCVQRFLCTSLWLIPYELLVGPFQATQLHEICVCQPFLKTNRCTASIFPSFASEVISYRHAP